MRTKIIVLLYLCLAVCSCAKISTSEGSASLEPSEGGYSTASPETLKITKTPDRLDFIPTRSSMPVSSPAPSATFEPTSITFTNPKDALYVLSRDMAAYFFIDPNDAWNFSPNKILSAPGVSASGVYFSESVSFSHFSNLVAFIDTEKKFWISDLAHNNPTYTQLVIPNGNSYGLSQGLLKRLIWTPDDQHIIIGSLQAGQAGLIYHRKTGSTEEWHFICDRLAISPRTQKVATWCNSDTKSNSFAVIEWGGEIWESDFPPSIEWVKADRIYDEDLASRLFSIDQYAGWSADGERVAYFNPKDKDGSLTISSSDGKVQKQIQGKAYWLSFAGQDTVHIPGKPIQWSLNGKRILLFGAGQPGHPCEEVGIGEVPSQAIGKKTGCWQVIDAESGAKVWNVAELKDRRGIVYEKYPYGNAAISSDGQYVAVYTPLTFDRHLLGIDLDKDEVIFDPPYSITLMQWGIKP